MTEKSEMQRATIQLRIGSQKKTLGPLQGAAWGSIDEEQHVEPIRKVTEDAPARSVDAI
jgi:hypothetical protein